MLPPFVSWVAQLRGCTVLVPGILTGARQGPIVTYRRVFNIKRIIFISGRFQTQFSHESRLLRQMAQNTSWRFLDTPDEFQQVKTEANAKTQRANVLGLFTSAEVAAARGALPQYLMRHMFDVQGFLDFLRNISLADSNLGAKQL